MTNCLMLLSLGKGSALRLLLKCSHMHSGEIFCVNAPLEEDVLKPLPKAALKEQFSKSWWIAFPSTILDKCDGYKVAEGYDRRVNLL